MVPTRLSLITCNIWLTERWPARAPALERFLALFAPDVFCVQELQRPTQEFLDRVLSGYARVQDPFSGWTNESNIYWNEALLEETEHGAEDVAHVEPERRMSWARLQIKSSQRTVFVATAHLTSARHGDESETGVSPRVQQLKRIADELTRRVKAYVTQRRRKLPDELTDREILFFAFCFACIVVPHRSRRITGRVHGCLHEFASPGG